MDVTNQYKKPRNKCGRPPYFTERGPKLDVNILENKSEFNHYILRNPVDSSTQHGPGISKQEVNTIRTVYTNTGVNHVDGGWPKEAKDPETTQNYRRKIEKDDGYTKCVMATSRTMEKLILQNNAIDVYQPYFSTTDTLPKNKIMH